MEVFKSVRVSDLGIKSAGDKKWQQAPEKRHG